MASGTSDVDETLKRVQQHKGVLGLLIAGPDGTAIRSTMDNSTTLSLSSNLCPLAQKANSYVRDLDPNNSLCFMRLTTTKQEFLIAPDKTCYLIALQQKEA